MHLIHRGKNISGKKEKIKFEKTLRWALDGERLDEFQLEVAVLQEFFRATHGTNWKRATNWLNTHKHISEWHGVRLSNQGRVIEIGLPNNNVAGSLPPCLGQLKHLKRLFLEGNHIHGPVPCLKQCRNLVSLHLQSNKLQPLGPGHGTNELFGTRERGLPASLFQLPRLRHIYVHDNQLTMGIAVGCTNIQVLKEAANTGARDKSSLLYQSRSAGSLGGAASSVPDERWSIRYQLHSGSWLSHDVSKEQFTSRLKGVLTLKDTVELQCQKLIKDGSQAFNNGDIVTARNRFAQCISLRPSKAYAYHGMAQCIMAAIRWEEADAIDHYQEALGYLHKSIEYDQVERQHASPVPGVNKLVSLSENLRLLAQLQRSFQGGFTWKQKLACMKIQALWRTREARLKMKEMLLTVFEKRQDGSGHYYYVNKRTGESTWEEPALVKKLAHDMEVSEAQQEQQQQLSTALSSYMDGGQAAVGAGAPGSAPMSMEQMARSAFKKFDSDGTGHIDGEELGSLVVALGYPMEQSAVAELLQWLDKSGDGQVDEEEFVAWWTSGQ